MVELITTLVLIGILMAVAVPRMLAPSPFKVRTLADEIAAEIRYTQQLNMNYDANATFRIQPTASGYRMDIRLPDAGSPPEPRTVLRSGQGEGDGMYNAYRLIEDVAVIPDNFSVSFDKLGRPDTVASLKVTTDTISSCLRIVEETGFVEVEHDAENCP